MWMVVDIQTLHLYILGLIKERKQIKRGGRPSSQGLKTTLPLKLFNLQMWEKYEAASPDVYEIIISIYIYL